MDRKSIKRTWIAVVIIFLVISMGLGGVFFVQAKMNNDGIQTPSKARIDLPVSSADDVDRLSQTFYNMLHHRGLWLYDLMNATADPPVSDRSDIDAVFEEAYSRGIIDSYTDDDVHGSLDRRFVAQTIVKAFGYEPKSIGGAADIDSQDGDLETLAYYGWFLPDDSNCLYPNSLITSDEYDMLLDELDRYRLLRGKKVLSFGDSIMYGRGNDGEGISDMIAQKYGMECADYAVSGYSMGICKDRGHIAKQILNASAANEKADIILLNGATNDVKNTAFGTLTSGFDPKKLDETTFTGGFERSMWLISKFWKDVPVVYVRAHNMDLGKNIAEKKYGERGLQVAEKWGAATVDLYNESGLNTEDPEMRSKYTFKRDGAKRADSIHPTALGYAKFYLPLTGEKMEEQFK